MYRENKGITLIALVVTIIILIILAGVGIHLVLGQYGIIARAKEAEKLTEEEQKNETIALEELSNILEGNIGSNGIQKEKSELEKLKDTGTFLEKPTEVEDALKNKVVIPKGFKIAEDSGLTVDKGIVIEDNDIIQGIGNNRRQSICMGSSRRNNKRGWNKGYNRVGKIFFYNRGKRNFSTKR